jgi:hypothetical protein
MDNLRVAAERLKAMQNVMHSQGMTKGDDTGRELTGAGDAPLNGAGDDRGGYVAATTFSRS